MKKLCLQLLLLCSLGLIAVAQSNAPIPRVNTTILALPVFTLNAQPVSQVSTGVTGTAGQQTIYYWIVANYQIGSVMSGPFVAFGSPNTLSVSNFVTLFPTYPANVVSIDVLKTTGTLQPTAACNCAVATGVTGGTINDQSNSTNSYTVTLLDPNTLVLTLTNEVTGTGVSHLLLKQNGVLVADLSNVGSSGITGSGTANSIPKFTGASAVGNSSLSDNGSFVTGTEPISVTTTIGTSGLNRNIATASLCNGNGSFVSLPFAGGCDSFIAWTGNPASGTTTGAYVGGHFRAGQGVANSSTASMLVGLIGESLGIGTLTTQQYGIAALGSGSHSNSTVPINGGLLAIASNGSLGITYTNNIGVDVLTTLLTASTNTNDIGVHVQSPSLVAGSTMTHHYGVFIEDQTVAGAGTNSDPWGIFEAGTAKNQFGGVINGVSGFTQNGTALGIGCGTTTTCANNLNPLVHFVFGSAPLVSGTPSVATVTGISPAYTSSSSYFCTVTNGTTQANPIKWAPVSGSSFAVTGPNTVTDVISYVCIGS